MREVRDTAHMKPEKAASLFDGAFPLSLKNILLRRKIMVRKSTRFLSLLTAVLLLGTACSTNNPETGDPVTPDSPAPAEEAEAVPAEEEIPPEEEERVAGPEAADLGGYAFRILTSVWYDNNRIIAPEELTGEVINDAVYNANLNTMSTYNCVFSPIVLNDYPSVTAAMTSAVKAGMDEYDMSLNHDNQTVSSALSGNHLNIRSSDVFNFDAPWWTRTADDFTVGGGLYFAANYTTYSPMYFGFALVYNKTIAEDNGLEIPYDKIIVGEWYLDDLIALTKDMNRDLDGDGVMEVGVDQYGFMASTLGLVNFQVSLGNFLLGKDEEGYLMLNIDEERLAKTLDAVERLIERDQQGRRRPVGIRNEVFRTGTGPVQLSADPGHPGPDARHRYPVRDDPPSEARRDAEGLCVRLLRYLLGDPEDRASAPRHHRHHH